MIMLKIMHYCMSMKAIYSRNVKKKKFRCVLKFNADCTGARVMLRNNLGEHCSVSQNVAFNKENTLTGSWRWL